MIFINSLIWITNLIRCYYLFEMRKWYNLHECDINHSMISTMSFEKVLHVPSITISDITYRISKLWLQETDCLFVYIDKNDNTSLLFGYIILSFNVYMYEVRTWYAIWCICRCKALCTTHLFYVHLCVCQYTFNVHINERDTVTATSVNLDSRLWRFIFQRSTFIILRYYYSICWITSV